MLWKLASFNLRCVYVTKMWIDNLVNTVIIMMNFSRGGQEGDWVLSRGRHATVLPFCWLSQLLTLCCFLSSSHERTRSSDDEDTSVWCIRAPHPRHLQLNLDGHVHRNNIHAAGAWTDIWWSGPLALLSVAKSSNSVRSLSVRSLSKIEQDRQQRRSWGSNQNRPGWPPEPARHTWCLHWPI